jgi:hypothetical protein
VNANQTVKVDTETLGAGAQSFDGITTDLSHISGALDDAASAASGGFGNGQVGKILTQRVLPQAKELSQGTSGLSKDTGQTAAGMKTSYKGYTSTNDENNASVGAISRGVDGGGRGED